MEILTRIVSVRHAILRTTVAPTDMPMSPTLLLITSGCSWRNWNALCTDKDDPEHSPLEHITDPWINRLRKTGGKAQPSSEGRWGTDESIHRPENSPTWSFFREGRSSPQRLRNRETQAVRDGTLLRSPSCPINQLFPERVQDLRGTTV